MKGMIIFSSIMALSIGSANAKLPSLDFIKRGGFHCTKNCIDNKNVCHDQKMYNKCEELCIKKRRKDEKTEEVKRALEKCDVKAAPTQPKPTMPEAPSEEFVMPERSDAPPPPTDTSPLVEAPKIGPVMPSDTFDAPAETTEEFVMPETFPHDVPPTVEAPIDTFDAPAGAPEGFVSGIPDAPPPPAGMPSSPVMSGDLQAEIQRGKQLRPVEPDTSASVPSGREGLLGQIREGVQLKPVDPSTIAPPPKTDSEDLAGVLRQGLDKVYKATHGNDEEEEDHDPLRPDEEWD